MLNKARRDALFVAIAVCVFLIGTATGNALAMLVISVAALVVLTVYDRKRSMTWAVLAALAAVTAALVSVILTIW
jgi:hypothetical protein